MPANPLPPGRAGHAPAGWPAGVRPPGAPGWERTAVGWLLDLCPPDYRAYELLRRQPVVLARFAALHVGAGVEAARRGYATARADLRDLGPEVVTATLETWEREGARLAAAERAVALVEAALRGQRFTPRL